MDEQSKGAHSDQGQERRNNVLRNAKKLEGLPARICELLDENTQSKARE